MKLNKRKITAVACVIVPVLAVWYFGLHQGLFWQRTLRQRDTEIRPLQQKLQALMNHELDFYRTPMQLKRQNEELEKLRKENEELRQNVAKQQLDEPVS